MVNGDVLPSKKRIFKEISFVIQVEDFLLMNISSFVEFMSRGVSRCTSCKTSLRLNFPRLFRCIEPHYDNSVEWASPAFLDL